MAQEQIKVFARSDLAKNGKIYLVIDSLLGPTC